MVPGVVGCGTYALVIKIDDAALAVAHPVTPSAASSIAQAMPKTDVSLRMTPTLPCFRGGRPPGTPRSYPLSAAVPRRPSGGEPRSSSALWKRRSVKPGPHSFLARSRSLRISSLPHVYRP